MFTDREVRDDELDHHFVQSVESWTDRDGGVTLDCTTARDEPRRVSVER